MAGDWIKMRNDLADDPAVIAIAGKVGLDEFAVVGRLHALWAWADEQSRDGHAPGVTSAWLDRKVQRDGFAAALVSVGWLVVGDDGLQLPNFDHHNGKTAKVRGLGTRRKQAQRAGAEPAIVPPIVPPVVASVSPIVSRSERDGCVTREEKRREEKKTLPVKTGEGRFLDFWTSWPNTDRKTDRKKCLAKWRLGNYEEQAAAILVHIEAMKLTRKWSQGFEPAPLRYLNGEQWRDGVVIQAQDVFAGAI